MVILPTQRKNRIYQNLSSSQPPFTIPIQFSSWTFLCQEYICLQLPFINKQKSVEIQQNHLLPLRKLLWALLPSFFHHFPTSIYKVSGFSTESDPLSPIINMTLLFKVICFLYEKISVGARTLIQEIFQNFLSRYKLPKFAYPTHHLRVFIQKIHSKECQQQGNRSFLPSSPPRTLISITTHRCDSTFVGV